MPAIEAVCVCQQQETWGSAMETKAGEQSTSVDTPLQADESFG